MSLEGPQDRVDTKAKPLEAKKELKPKQTPKLTEDQNKAKEKFDRKKTEVKAEISFNLESFKRELSGMLGDVSQMSKTPSKRNYTQEKQNNEGGDKDPGASAAQNARERAHRIAMQGRETSASNSIQKDQGTLNPDNIAAIPSVKDLASIKPKAAPSQPVVGDTPIDSPNGAESITLGRSALEARALQGSGVTGEQLMKQFGVQSQTVQNPLSGKNFDLAAKPLTQVNSPKATAMSQKPNEPSRQDAGSMNYIAQQ